MAPPASASDFLRALRAEGLTVVEVGDSRFTEKIQGSVR